MDFLEKNTCGFLMFSDNPSDTSAKRRFNAVC